MDYKLLENVSVVSFDIYDTLIKRTVEHPYDVFDIVQLNFEKKHGDFRGNFKKKRMNAEKLARKNRTRDDITLDDIYNVIDLDNQYKEMFKNIEIEVEKEICVPNKKYVDYLKELSNTKRIIITTDMYLPRDVIINILNNCGIFEKFYEKIYISGEIGLAKYTGRIFDYIISDLKVEPSKILHIGDNYNNDIFYPKEKGIKTIEVKNEIGNIIYNNYIKSSKNVLLNHIMKISDYFIRDNASIYYNIGFSTFGPIIYSFCYWLNNMVEKQDFDSIVFLSREGFLLKKAYDSLYNQVPTCYLGINRNTLFMPMMHLDSSINSFFDNIPLSRKKYSVEDLIKYLDDSVDINNLAVKYNLSIKTKYGKEELLNNKDFLQLFDYLVFKNKEKYLKQYTYLIDYLKENFKGKKIAIVNNSISASAQKKLIKLIKLSDCEYQLTGIHFIRKKDTYLKNIKSCVWFNKDCPQYKKIIFYRNCIVFEKILFPVEGTALFYEKKNDHIGVVKEKNTYERLNKNMIEELQNGILEFISEYKKHIPISLDNKDSLNILHSLMSNPSLMELDALKDFSDFEEGSLKKMINQENCFSKDIISNSWWKPGVYKYYKKSDLLFKYRLKIFLKSKVIQYLE